jgi:hypothetical protein
MQKQTNKVALVFAASLLLLASACGEDAAGGGANAEQGGEAAGDLLGGSISDDMLPLGELQSQSPPAEPPPITIVTSTGNGAETVTGTDAVTSNTGAPGQVPPEPPAAPE